jgi:succinylglutamate desuccinylase
MDIRPDERGHIQVVINSPKRIPQSGNRYLEKDLEGVFRHRFQVHALARDSREERQIHEAKSDVE